MKLNMNDERGKRGSAGQVPSQVWYACYGSNLSSARFFTYLTPGTPPGLSEDSEPQVGSRNQSFPTLDWHAETENWQTTFRGKSSRWGEGGVAYLEPRDPEHPTLPAARLRLWLLEFKQFVDVYLQENGINPFTLNPDQLQAVETWLETTVLTPSDGQGFLPNGVGMPEPLLTSLYRRILPLGERNGIPVMSFTSPDNTGDFSAPPENYVETIAVGLFETYPESKVDKILNYLAQTTSLSDLEPLVARAVIKYLDAGKEKVKQHATKPGAVDLPLKGKTYSSCGKYVFFRVASTKNRKGNHREFIVQLPGKIIQEKKLKANSFVAVSNWHRGKEFRVLAMLLIAPDENSSSMCPKAEKKMKEATIFMDQKLRVAIGARKGDFVRVRQLTFAGVKSCLADFFERKISTQPQIMRVQRASFEDMEIDIARMPAETFDVIGISPGFKARVSSTTSSKSVRTGILSVKQKETREKEIERALGMWDDSFDCLELHRMTGGRGVDELPTIFIDKDMRDELKVEPMQPVRVVRDSRDVAMSRIYLILTPIALGIIATAFFGSGSFWHRLLWFSLLFVLTLWVVIFELRNKFKN